MTNEQKAAKILIEKGKKFTTKDIIELAKKLKKNHK